MAERSVWSWFHSGMNRFTPSHLKTSLSGSATTPVSSAITECGILKVEAGNNACPERSASLAITV